MAFFGAVVKPGKPMPQVPHPDPAYNLHLSQACLPASVPKGKRVSLLVNHEDEDPVVIATMVAGQMDSVPLDLFFSEYVEFTLEGDQVDVHISGYYSPVHEPGEDDDGMDGMPLGYGEDEDDEGEEDEDEDEDGEEDEDEDEDDEAVLAYGNKPKVIIEEVTDDAEVVAKKGKQLAVNGTAVTTTQMLVDEGDDGEDEDEGDDEDEGEDEDEEGEEDEDEEEQEEPQAAPSKAALKAVSKRPAEASPAQQQLSKKQQKQAQKEQAAAAKPAAAAQPAKQGKEAKGKEAAQAGTSGAAGEVKTAKKNVRRWENGFEIEEVALGPPDGKLAKAGKKVLVHYTGRLKSNGKVFDKSGNKPFSFRLGVGEVIKGWDLGVEGMRVGDKRKLTIPAQLAYGSTGVKGTIPGNATLEFDVQLHDVK